MSTSPPRSPVFDVYSDGRAAALDVLRNLRRFPPLPVRDGIHAAASHSLRNDPVAVPIVESDVAFLLAHAIDPAIQHVLDGRLPHILDRFDQSSTDERTAFLVAAERSAGQAPVLSGSRPPVLEPASVAVPSWLHNEQLRSHLGGIVAGALNSAYVFYTGGAHDRSWFVPGSVPLSQALDDAVQAVDAAVGPEWAVFVHVQMAHAFTTAFHVTPGVGPLGQHVDAFMRYLPDLEPITIADVLYVAGTDFARARRARPQPGTPQAPTPPAGPLSQAPATPQLPPSGVQQPYPRPHR
jgi:hypothetical protein